MQKIYKKYRERFIEISGKSRTLFTRSIVKKYTFDLESVLSYGDADAFYEFLWRKRDSLDLVNEKIAKKMLKASGEESTENQNTPADVVADLKYLKREVEELQKETGKYDLYIGFPFVTGRVSQDMPIKAPLLFFPVTLSIEKETASLVALSDQPVVLNRSFLKALCNEQKIKADNLLQEFDPLGDESFSSLEDILAYLNGQGITLSYQKRKTVLPFTEIQEFGDKFEVRNVAVLGRFPLSNPIYNDYVILEKENLTTPSLDLLLQGKVPKEKPTIRFFRRKKETKEEPVTYPINDLDFAQENAIEEVNRTTNLVLYGPPGTGKSQTIVNVISDALCKNKRVLVVSQKRAALDVVFSRLNKLNGKAMLIPDPENDKLYFFDRIRQMHAQVLREDFRSTQMVFQRNETDIHAEIRTLEEIDNALFSPTSFGISLQEMFAQSYNIGKETRDYKLYTDLTKTDIVKQNYQQLSENLRYIRDKKLTDLYISYNESIKNNPLVVHIDSDIDMHKLREVHTFIQKILESPMKPFDFSSYPYSRYLSAFYLEKTANTRPELPRVADIVMAIDKKGLTDWTKASTFPALLWLYPFLKGRYQQEKKDIVIDLNIALKAFQDFEEPYLLLQQVLDEQGYSLVIGGLFNGNYNYLRSLQDALENYVAIKDMNKALHNLQPDMKLLLDFSYTHSDKSQEGFDAVLSKMMPLRVYHEILKNEKVIEEKLSKTVGFDSIRERILRLKADQRELSKSLAADKNSQAYLEYLESHEEESKNFLYQVQKTRGLWPIRRMMEYFSEYLFRLFPCWLLSPQAVSTIFPLKKDMFDLVVFDEASQIFIENAIPSIYRGKNIVVAGDNKQLRPSSGFVRRYQADDTFDPMVDLSTQAALEVESLLDLASAKFHPVHLLYHYRSQYSELIDFSNMAFYENNLQIAPGIVLSETAKPIERIKVKGTWQNRHNHEEAVAVVKLVKTVLKDRQNNETLGIVTFNSEQKEYIEDLLDAEADKNSSFRRLLAQEQNRNENGENKSIFVKNLENVQGDERDIIIFSIGYAKNENDRVIAQFGSLSQDGGENRLNVAVTRAKKKVYVVTSIEPEELSVNEASKNNGAKLLKKYLLYVRAVSENKAKEVTEILQSMSAKKESGHIGAYEEQIRAGLEKMGYTVYTNLGNTTYKLSLGVYDDTLQRFILGIECDYQAYLGSKNIMERDVYRIKFLESRGWKVVRVWSRDWWQAPETVLKKLSSTIEAIREEYMHNA